MAMTYAQKRELLAWLADPGNWEFRDITEILLDPGRKASIRYENGKKYKILEDGSVIEVPKEEESKPLWSTYTSIIHFRDKDWPAEDQKDLVNWVKLAVALDLNVEPDMKAQNKLRRSEGGDNDKVTEEIPWNDTTEFEGFATGLTYRFAIEKTDDGFLLATVLEQKERILNQAGIALAAQNDPAARVSFGNEPLTNNGIIGKIYEGATGKTPFDGTWLYSVIETDDPPALAKKARHLLGEILDLPREKFTALTIDGDAVLIAVNREQFEKVVKARRATMAFMKVAEEGFPAGQDPAAFIAQATKDGADAKYIDPETLSPAFRKAVATARTGESLADILTRVLMTRQDLDTLIEMQKQGLIDKDSVKRPPPPGPPGP